MNKLFGYLLLIVVGLSEVAVAKDFGIEGHTYEIAEENILKVIERQLLAVDMAKLKNEMKDKTRKYAERPTEVKGIILARGNSIFYFDPTYTLDHDIKDHDGKLIHKAGTKVNPLEYMPLREALIFIDGDNKKHIEYALHLRKEKKLKIVLVRGSTLSLQKEHQIWIYFDQKGIITNKLGIKEIPALVEQEGLKLRIKISGEVNHE